MKPILIILFGLLFASFGKGLSAQPEIVFKPYDPGAPEARVGGSIRGTERELSIAVVAPSQIAVTTQASPALYWFASNAITDPVELVLIVEGGEQPLVEVLLEPPLASGIHSFEIPESIALESGLTYQWSIAVVPDPDSRSNDVFASALMTRVPLPSGLSNLESNEERANWLASNGIWYDAIAELSTRINDNTDHESPARLLRARLLQQVGLSEIAEYELQEIQP